MHLWARTHTDNQVLLCAMSRRNWCTYGCVLELVIDIIRNHFEKVHPVPARVQSYEIVHLVKPFDHPALVSGSSCLVRILNHHLDVRYRFRYILDLVFHRFIHWRKIDRVAPIVIQLERDWKKKKWSRMDPKSGIRTTIHWCQRERLLTEIQSVTFSTWWCHPEGTKIVSPGYGRDCEGHLWNATRNWDSHVVRR